VATIQEIQEAIIRQFPDGARTTLQQFQLTQILSFARTLRDNSNQLNALLFILKSNQEIFLEDIEKKLQGEGDSINEEIILIALALLAVRLKRLNKKIGKEIFSDVNDLGRAHRMRIMEDYDAFGFSPTDRKAIIFTTAAGLFALNKLQSQRRIATTVRRMDDTVDSGIDNARQLLADAIIDGKPARSILPEIRKNFRLNQSQVRNSLRTEGITSVSAASIDTYGEFGTAKYSWSSIFDSRTCPICARLNGRIFTVGDANAKRPPAHSHCRCTTIPLPSDKLFINENVRSGLNQEGEKETGQQFFEKMDEDELADTLGSKTKARLFKRGLPLHKIVNSQGRILRDKELNDLFGDFSDDKLKRITRVFGKKPIILKKQQNPPK